MYKQFIARRYLCTSLMVFFSLASPLLKQEQPMRQAIISSSLHWNMSLSFSKGCDQNYHSYVHTLVIFQENLSFGFWGKSCNSCDSTWASRRHPWGVASQPDPWWHLEQAKSSLSSSQCLAILPSWSTASPPSTTSNSTSLEQRQLDPQPHLQVLTGNSNALLQS